MPSQIFESHVIDDPALPFIFHLDRVEDKDPFLPNWHANIEILCCIHGNGHVICDANHYPFTKGDIFIVNSYMLHKITGDPFVQYYCCIIDQDFCRENGVPTEAIRFRSPIRNASVYRDYETVIAAFSDTGRERVIRIRHAVLGLLLALYRDYAEEESPVNDRHSDSAERVKETIRYIRQNFSQKLSLDEIAGHVGVSKYHLAHDFKKFSSQTIFEHLNIIRCKEAKRLIENGSSVSAAAVSCGFENMSYFSRTYKKYIGTLPSKS